MMEYVSKTGEAVFVVRNGRHFLRIFRPNLNKLMWFVSRGKGSKEEFTRLDRVSSQVLEDEYQATLVAPQ